MGAGANYSRGEGGGSGLDTIGGKINNQNRLNKETKEDLLNELKKKNAKITLKDAIFVTRDKSGQIVWLEKGTIGKGLNHIILRHRQDFVRKHNIEPNNLVSHLKNIIVKGNITSTKTRVLKDGKIGLEKVYKYKGKYYTVAAIGTNGFIISMYPKRGGIK